MDVDLIEIPYDSGHRDRRMGRGPRRLAENGVGRALERDSHAVRRRVVDTASPFPAEVATAFEIQRLAAATVAAARSRAAFPLLLSGNCNSAALGAVAGLGKDVAVIWLDAHADCETPETTESGFLDGMGAAMLIGRCWVGPITALPGFKPLTGDRLLIAGTRQVSRAETALMADAGVAHLPADHLGPAGLATALDPHLERWRSAGVRGVYLHLDLDVLDPGIAPANSYAEPGGLSDAEVATTIARISDRLPILAAALTAYDPDYDVDGRMPPIAAELARTIARAAG